MSKRTCSCEREIIEAVKASTAGAGNAKVSRATSSDLVGHAEHLNECAVCREAATVSNWLSAVALETERTTSVPAADAIWWRAQVVRNLCDQEEQLDKRTRPLMLVQMAAVLLTVVTIVGFVLTSDTVLGGLIGNLGDLLGGAPAAVLAVAALLSLVTGGLVALQVARELN
jgi:hypothetical protein